MNSESSSHHLLTMLFEVILVTLCHISSSVNLEAYHLTHLLHGEQMLCLVFENIHRKRTVMERPRPGRAQPVFATLSLGQLKQGFFFFLQNARQRQEDV